MTYYRYTHEDGRSGIGDSVWSAIRSAIGVFESENLPECNELDWEFGSDCRFWKMAQYIDRETGEQLGTVEQLRD